MNLMFLMFLCNLSLHSHYDRLFHLLENHYQQFCQFYLFTYLLSKYLLKGRHSIPGVCFVVFYHTLFVFVVFFGLLISFSVYLFFKFTC